MSYRNWDLKVQYETWARLRMAIKLYPVVCSVVRSPEIEMVSSRMTEDELAERGLTEWMKDKFPKVFELEKKIAKVQNDAVKELNGP